MQTTTLRRSALAALPTLALGAASAHATIVFSGPVDETISAGASLYFDLDQSSPTLTSHTTFDGADFFLSFGADTSANARALGYSPDKPMVDGVFNTGAYNSVAIKPIIEGTVPIPFTLKLDTGFAINATTGGWYEGGFLSMPPPIGGFWFAGSTGYLGLQIQVPGENANYGWAHVSYNKDLSLTLHDFAYANAGEAIAAGQTGASGAVPEPSTYGALAALVAGSTILFARRRKQAA
jgi:hypothetical protein